MQRFVPNSQPPSPSLPPLVSTSTDLCGVVHGQAGEAGKGDGDLDDARAAGGGGLLLLLGLNLGPEAMRRGERRLELTPAEGGGMRLSGIHPSC